MKVIRPTVFVKATHLVDSNAGETVALWNSGTTYASGQETRYADSIYASAQGSNTNHTPPTATDADAWWVRTAPSNVTAMFDTQISTTTTREAPLTVVVAVGTCNALALVGLSGTEVTVTGQRGVGGSEVYSATVSLADTTISGWYEWLFLPAETLSDLVLTGLPAYSDLVLTVTISGGSTAACGGMLWGLLYTLGDPLGSPRFGITDYSRKDTDEYGTTTFTRRANSKRQSAQILVAKAQINRVQRLMTQLTATPAVWILSADPMLAAGAIVYGAYKDSSVVVSYPSHSLLDIEIEGLT